MRVLITGSSGFLGTHFTRALMHEPAVTDVWVIDLKPNPIGLPADTGDMGAWARLAAGVDGYQTMNIGTGVETSFNEIAMMCAKIAGYDAAVENIVDRPTGVTRRVCDPTEMLKYYTPAVPLEHGLRSVMEE